MPGKLLPPSSLTIKYIPAFPLHIGEGRRSEIIVSGRVCAMHLIAQVRGTFAQLQHIKCHH
jgi:hypothetical protein